MLSVCALPGPPPFSRESARLAASWQDDAGRTYARARVGSDGYWLEWDGLGVFRLQPPDRQVSAWLAAGADPGSAERVFLRFLQPIALQVFGFQTLHASAVLSPSGALAFCGASGSGKSTIAFGLSHLGMPQLADDAVVLSLPGDAVHVHPLPFAPRLRASAVGALGPADSRVALDERAAVPCRLRAIALLIQSRATDELVTVERVPQHRAFASVLTHAHSFDPEGPEEAARLAADYLDIVERTPVFRVTYVPDFSRLQVLLEAVSDHLTGAHPVASTVIR